MTEKEVLKKGLEIWKETRGLVSSSTRILSERTGINTEKAREIIEKIESDYDAIYDYCYNEQDDHTDYESMDIEELRKQIEKEKLIAELRALKKQNSESDFSSSENENEEIIPGTSIKITHDYTPEEEKRPMSTSERAELNKRKGILMCPKCGSKSITTTNKKVSVKRGLIGGALLGPLGAGVGAVTSKKMYNVCMNCGHKWEIK